MPDCFCANRLTLRGCAGLQRFSARSSPLTRRSQRPRRSDRMARACARIFCRSMPQIFCVFAQRIRARSCRFSVIPAATASGGLVCVGEWFPPVPMGATAAPCAHTRATVVRSRGLCWTPPPSLHHLARMHRVCMCASCLHACGARACIVPASWLHACMHRFPACTMHFFSMCAAFCAPPGRHASGLHACNVPACLLRACMHAGFSFDVQAVLGLSTSQHLPGSTRRSGTIGRTVTVDDRRET